MFLSALHAIIMQRIGMNDKSFFTLLICLCILKSVANILKKSYKTKEIAKTYQKPIKMIYLIGYI